MNERSQIHEHLRIVFHVSRLEKPTYIISNKMNECSLVSGIFIHLVMKNCILYVAHFCENCFLFVPRFDSNSNTIDSIETLWITRTKELNQT